MIIASELCTKQKLSICGLLICFQIMLEKDIMRKIEDRL